MKKARQHTTRYMVTGGHVTPALATIDEIMAQDAHARVVFVGRKHSIEGSDVESEEFRLITQKNIRFLPLVAGRLKREGGIFAIASLLKVPVGFFQAIVYVAKEKPDIIVSFGGYVALPVVVAGWLFRIPIVTHEQTRCPGLANRWISILSRYTCTSFPKNKADIGFAGPVTYTGLPMRADVFFPPARLSFDLPKGNQPLLVIVGGSTGSVSINAVVFEALPAILSVFRVVHQTGRMSQKEAEDAKIRLESLGSRYVPRAYIDAPDYSYVLHHGAIIVGRSGANTVLEIAAIGKPALFIPLPWSGQNEQLHNAELLKTAGSAVILPQHELSAESLVAALTDMRKNLKKYSDAAGQIAPTIPRDGAKRFVSVIESVVRLS